MAWRGVGGAVGVDVDVDVEVSRFDHLGGGIIGIFISPTLTYDIQLVVLALRWLLAGLALVQAGVGGLVQVLDLEGAVVVSARAGPHDEPVVLDDGCGSVWRWVTIKRKVGLIRLVWLRLIERQVVLGILTRQQLQLAGATKPGDGNVGRRVHQAWQQN